MPSGGWRRGKGPEGGLGRDCVCRAVDGGEAKGLRASPEARGTRRVCRWSDGQTGRWSAAAWVEAEKGFRRIMGYRHLWMLKTCLDDEPAAGTDDA